MDTRRGESRIDAQGGSRHDAFTRTRGVYARRVKPLLDRVLGAVLLVVAVPLFVVVAMAIAATMGRPILYTRDRIGHNGKPFLLYKFRTMLPDRRSEELPYEGDERRVNHKSTSDPRHTSVGRLLRASRLDELPQLWNVVKGEMSLVGPRPEVPSVVDRYEAWQHQRHLVKPGLTGLWQISEHNGRPMHECTEIDLEYLHRISFFQDLSILVRTPLAMLGKRRGY